VTLKPDQATIQGNAKTTDLEKSIENAGFEVVK
jgi:hypothetical protein